MERPYIRLRPEAPMTHTTWRTWAGLAFTLLGALLLLWSLGRRPESPGPGPHSLRLSLAGAALLDASVSPEAVAAALWLRWLAVPLAPLLLGAFLLFLETPGGQRVERKLLGWIKRLEGRG